MRFLVKLPFNCHTIRSSKSDNKYWRGTGAKHTTVILDPILPKDLADIRKLPNDHLLFSNHPNNDALLSEFLLIERECVCIRSIHLHPLLTMTSFKDTTKSRVHGNNVVHEEKRYS